MMKSQTILTCSLLAYRTGHREFIADPGKTPIVETMTSAAPSLHFLIEEDVQRHDTFHKTGGAGNEVAA